MNGKKFTALLTATVSPRGAGREIQRRDPAIRLRDYEASLEFWLRRPIRDLQAIVFAENSNFDLTSLKAIAREKNPHDVAVEFLSFDEPGPPPGLHYGYSEFKLVRAAVQRSQYLSTSPYFIKATGRYMFPALPHLIRKLPNSFKVALDARGARPFSRQKNFIIQFALGVYEIEFFREHLWGLPEIMIPAPPWTRSQFIESVLFDKLYPMRKDPGVILRWPCNCEPAGVGANGDNYTSLKKKIQSGLRAACRRGLPQLWI